MNGDSEETSPSGETTESDADSPTVRTAEADDVERIRELARSSMTTSYGLSPQDIETILEAAFSEEAQRERLDASDTVALVAEVDGVLSGFVEGTVAGNEGTVRWLQVDPERRGQGVGTALVERVVSELRDRDAETVRGIVLGADMEGEQFFERFGFEEVDDREVDIGGRETVEDVYVHELGEDESVEPTEDAEGAEDEPSAEEAESASRADPESTPNEDFPETADADGEEVYLGEDYLAGTEAAFAPTFTDAERTEQYGFYCGNCGSTDVSMDSMERLKCSECGNTHKADDDYDGSYL